MADLAAYRREVDAALQQMASYTDRYAGQALAAVATARRDVLDAISSAATDPDGLIERRELGYLLGQVQAAGAQLAVRLLATAQEGLDGSWEYGAGLLPHALDAAGIIAALGPQMNRALLAQLQQFTVGLMRSVSQSFIDDATQRLQLAILGGKPIAELLSDLRDLLRTQPDRQNPELGSIAYQAERVQRTEMLRAFNSANYERQKDAAGAVPGLKKYWLTAGDDRVREAHVQAGLDYGPENAINIDDPFMVDGEELQYPGDPAGSPGNTISCRCISDNWREDWAPTQAPEESGQEAA